MMKCPKCNKEFENSVKFCDLCGTKVEEIKKEPAADEFKATEFIFCTNCGAKYRKGTLFCSECGSKLAAGDVAKQPFERVTANKSVNTAVGVKNKHAAPKHKKNKKSVFSIIAVGTACVALVLVAAIIIGSVLIFGNSAPNYTLYIKDHELFYTGLSKINPVQITEELLDGSYSDLSGFGMGMASYTFLSDDGKTLFYADELDSVGDVSNYTGVTMYCRSVSNIKKEPIKIDDEILSIQPSKDGKKIVYRTYDENLYLHNLKEKEKIDGNVVIYNVSEDCKKIVYMTYDYGQYDIYYKAEGKEKVKLDSNIDSFVTEDFDTVFYIKGDNLYKKTVGKDRVKLDSNVSSIKAVYETGEVYYIKSDSKNVKAIDYIEDDMKDKDEAFVMPEYPDAPSSGDYGTNEEYEEAYKHYEELCDEYYDAQNEYNAIENRNELREGLKDYEISLSVKSLYYCSGKKSVLISDSLTAASGKYTTAAADKAMVAFYDYDKSSIKKVKISEIGYFSEIENNISEAIADSVAANVVIKDKVTKLDRRSAMGVSFSDNCKAVYFFDNVDEEEYTADLYKASISGSKVKKSNRIDTAVDNDNFALFKGSVVYTKKNDGDEHSTLYIDGKKISDDVRGFKTTEYGCLIYITDYDSDNECGTLNFYKNGKSKKIADDVDSYNVAVTSKGDILYLYGREDRMGELYLFNGRKSKKIDEDVTLLVQSHSYWY